MAHSKAAGRYARSLYQISVETKTTDLVLADMQLYLDTIGQSKELEIAIQSPIIPGFRKLGILNDLFGKRFQSITNQFIDLIVSKGRETELRNIAEAFIHEHKLQMGIKEGWLISATALSDANRQSLLKKAEQIAGSKVSIIEKIDPSLIGGYILKIGDLQLDESVKTKLVKLRDEVLDHSYIAKI